MLLDLEYALTTKYESTLNINGGEFKVSKEELAFMGTQLRRKVSRWAEEVFVDEEVLSSPRTTAILNALSLKFPHVSPDHLKAKACHVVNTREEQEWNAIVQKIHEENENLNPDAGFQRFRYISSDPIDMTNEHALHHMTAAFHFTKELSLIHI